MNEGIRRATILHFQPEDIIVYLLLEFIFEVSRIC
jgi:hypothetical protein